MKKPEVRSIELRAADGEQLRLVGRAITYGALSSPVGNAGFKERIAAGAFADCLRSNPDVRFLVNHDASKILGRTTAGTLSIQDSDTGLDFVVNLDPNNSDARNIHASVRRQDLSQCSFAFVVDNSDGDGDEFDQDIDPETGERFARRTIKRAKLFDLSCVTYPQYPNGTSIQARSAAQFVNRLFPDSQNRDRAIIGPQGEPVIGTFRTQKSLEEQYPTAAAFMLNKYRSLRQAAEIRRDQQQASADARLRARLARQEYKLFLEQND